MPVATPSGRTRQLRIGITAAESSAEKDPILETASTVEENDQNASLACPSCDLVFDVSDLADGETARCSRCGHVLTRYRADDLSRVMAYTVSAVILLALFVIIRVEPWYQPQYLIPLLGMLLGNTMSGIAIALDNLTRNAAEARGRIEARLLLGATWDEAIAGSRRGASTRRQAACSSPSPCRPRPSTRCAIVSSDLTGRAFRND